MKTHVLKGSKQEIAENLVRISGEVRVEPIVLRHRPAWRAQLVGLSQSGAQSACGPLARHGLPCVVLRVLPGRFASR